MYSDVIAKRMEIATVGWNGLQSDNRSHATMSNFLTLLLFLNDFSRVPKILFCLINFQRED